METSRDARLASLFFLRPKSWSSDFIRTDISLKDKARHSGSGVMDMIKHPDFRSKNVQSATILLFLHLILLLELPFKATAESRMILGQKVTEIRNWKWGCAIN